MQSSLAHLRGQGTSGHTARAEGGVEEEGEELEGVEKEREELEGTPLFLNDSTKFEASDCDWFG